MGLDNGIIVKTKLKYPPWLTGRDSHESVELENYEICYWRKFYGLRNEILNKVDINKALSPKDIENIIDILDSFTNHEYYEENSLTFWGYCGMFEILKHQIASLLWLRAQMNKQEIICEFYDSY